MSINIIFTFISKEKNKNLYLLNNIIITSQDLKVEPSKPQYYLIFLIFPLYHQISYGKILHLEIQFQIHIVLIYFLAFLIINLIIELFLLVILYFFDIIDWNPHSQFELFFSEFRKIKYH